MEAAQIVRTGLGSIKAFDEHPYLNGAHVSTAMLTRKPIIRYVRGRVYNFCASQSAL